MAGVRVAVHVDRARLLEHSPGLDQPDRHHREVGQHVPVGAEEHLERQHHLAQGRRHLHAMRTAIGQLAKGVLGVVVPRPGVHEGGLLRPRALGDHAVRAVGIEGRVEVDEVDRSRPPRAGAITSRLSP